MTDYVKIYCLCLSNLHILDLAGPIQAFSSYRPKENRFNITYISPTTDIMTAQNITISNLEPLPEEIEEDAIILVPGTQSELIDFKDKHIIRATQWLGKFKNSPHRIVCICAGALYAARANLLINKSCTTHHQLTEKLKKLSPSSKVVDNQIFIEDGNIFTCAGITTGIDLSLHLIESYYGIEAAIEVARELVVYFRRNGNDQQMSAWLQYRNHFHPLVHKAQNIINSDPTKHWSLDEIACTIGISKRHLSRLFKDNTGIQIKDYHYNLRIEVAKQLFKEKKYNIDQIANKVGFNTTASFRTAWKKLVGNTPREHLA
jgi:transcriptional regulator GlxA family with amidase domain